MLNGIGSAANIAHFLTRVKDKSDGVRLMGFSHCFYKYVDPRAKIIRSMCYRVLEKMGKGNDPLFELAAFHVHGHVRDRAHRRLGCSLAGNGLRSAYENRPSAPALYGTHK
jgi:citrate synthase